MAVAQESRSVDGAYFVELYRRRADPWDFAGSRYERKKYAETISVLPASIVDVLRETAEYTKFV